MNSINIFLIRKALFHKIYQTLNIDFYSTTIKNNKKNKSVYFANMLVCKSKYKINDFTKSAKLFKKSKLSFIR